VTVDIAGAYLNADMTGQEVLMKLDQTMSTILVKIRPDYKPFLTADGTMIIVTFFFSIFIITISY